MPLARRWRPAHGEGGPDASRDDGLQMVNLSPPNPCPNLSLLMSWADFEVFERRLLELVGRREHVRIVPLRVALARSEIGHAMRAQWRAEERLVRLWLDPRIAALDRLLLAASAPSAPILEAARRLAPLCRVDALV